MVEKTAKPKAIKKTATKQKYKAKSRVARGVNDPHGCNDLWK
jgi:hypothetical protein